MWKLENQCIHIVEVNTIVIVKYTRFILNELSVALPGDISLLNLSKIKYNNLNMETVLYNQNIFMEDISM